MWRFSGKRRPVFAIEPGPGQESVWDYPRPPVCVNDSREITVRHNDLVIARTFQAIRVLETASPPTYYLPRSAVNLELLVPFPGSTFCEWKGIATYWSLQTDLLQIDNVGWSYETPSARFGAIKSFLAFYPGKLNCKVSDELVRPQDGDFYGGWVTDEIVGPFKGSLRTRGW